MRGALYDGCRRFAWRLFKAAGDTWPARLHRDEQGGVFEYVLVVAFVVVPLFVLFERLFQILSDYFGMIAFYVSWPFL